jgi:hypothetical protein
MKLLIKPFFLSLVCLYIINKLTILWIDNIPLFFKNYFSDLLFLPIVLIICLTVIRYIKKETVLKLNFFMVLALTLFYSWFFEIYAPKYYPHQIGDSIDIVMYFLGALIFLVYQKYFIV